MLRLSSSQFDPQETLAAQDFRSAKALFVPSLKRDIVPSIACTRPPAGGSHGNPHPTARIHIHTGRRSSCVAARGARAAGERMRRIGVLMAHDRRTIRKRTPASRRSRRVSSESGWTVGRNVRIDYRWAGGNADNMRKYAAELVALAPDVILAHGSAAVAPLLQATRTMPIVFTRSSTRSARATSTAWRGRAATPPVFSCSNTASPENGWSCLKRSRRA